MGLQELQHNLIRSRILPTLTALLPADKPCFLVGGAIRDALRNRTSYDYDFAIGDDPTALAQGFARAAGGHWFMLDGQRRQSRVVAGQGATDFVCDFAPFRATDLDGDLQKRDFTINAMAMALLPGCRLGALYDPLNGRADLRDGLLRCCSAQVLLEDPLRVLKGLRHCLCLRLTVESHTLRAMRLAASGVAQVAPERIRKELAAILAVTPAKRGLLWLKELGLLEMLLGASARTTAVDAGFALLERAEQWLSFLCQGDDGRRLGVFFAEELEQGVSRALVIKLAAWFTSQGVGDARAILRQLRCSRAVQDAVDCLLTLDRVQVEQLRRLPAISRSRALWADGLGSHPQLALIFLGLMLDASQRGAAETLLPILDDLRRHRVEGRVPSLVSGAWLQRTLQLQGPQIGRFLDALRVEEVAGRVLTVPQAEQFLQQMVEKND